MEIFRRSLAAFLVLMFIFFSLVTFTVFAFNNTFLRPGFYTGSLSQSGYDFIINISSKTIYGSDDLISKNFTQTDLKREISTVFTKEIYKSMMEDLANQIQKVKSNPKEPLVISFKLFRESLLTLANNLAYQIFRNIRQCATGEVPEENLSGFPTCLPAGIDYNLIAKPFTEKIGRSIYSQIPEERQFDLNSAKSGTDITPGYLISSAGSLKIWLYAILLTLLILIALLIYKPFSLVMFYEGTAFFLAGLAGYFLSFGIDSLPRILLSQVDLKEQNVDVIRFINDILTLFGGEAQKMTLAFMGFGAFLLIVQLFIKKPKNY